MFIAPQHPICRVAPLWLVRYEDYTWHEVRYCELRYPWVIWIWIFHRLDREIPQHHQDIVKAWIIRGASETKQATGIE
jgi:hypothetical protein